MEHILLPSTIEFQDTDEKNVAKVVITPCQQGYGTTLGNSLRRVLLSSLPGAAVESVKINGTSHEFSAIDGVQEDMVEVILNLKQLAIKCHSDESIVLNLSKKGKGDITAADFEKNSDVEISNPDLKIMTVTDDKKEIDMEVTVGKGSGYVPVSEKDAKSLDLGTILIDSFYTPIIDVGYKVDMTRVGDVTNYEKLTLKVETNGTISPKEALSQSTKILMDYLGLVLEASDSGAAVPKTEEVVEEAEEEVEKKPKKKAVKKTTKKKDESVSA
ncbi:MAG: DNA-directed RNA polymerase subunit alpha [Candidatus Magasanikbacteria bacterium]|jgi:DNA-directed RNA polymerase subunit alpha|nr:DNA-directed RNA polymerase subunit alpha [Candidatus Magasanikbacteria bacterium]MBT4314922.1 DNA-directed RNA polymerase subunit alpha [Candidatus Magasanikbacteria bacterium]MBT4546878.1 DNA-directed RNA polymerase subunit alpha [Candidatus Magasanikbacteria bacterium]MBT6819208.1 DNA-directed RNA polymerase subunit alpha [Candidatus Magasanikbacteria bacterium]